LKRGSAIFSTGDMNSIFKSSDKDRGFRKEKIKYVKK